MANKLTWGLISTGAISKRFAKGLAASDTGELLAVASRTQEAADKFGDEFNVPRRYGSYDALLADPDVQAVYISTPHPLHAQWAIRAAEAGKHILCEKPVTLNWPEAMAVVEAARRNDVFFMEAFMYRCHPQTAEIVNLIKDRAIGDVRIIQATFSFNAGWNPEGRLLNPELGGGGILDVGCYCTSMSRLIAGAALGRDGAADPIEVKPMGHIGESGVDEYATALLKFPNDIIAYLSTGVQLNQENVVRIYGSEGNILIPSPWFCGEDVTIYVNRNDGASREVNIKCDKDLYALEADCVAAHIDKRQAPSPTMTPEDTLGNMRTLDAWRCGIGLLYPREAIDADFPTLDGRPLHVKTPNNMKYGEIEGVGKPVSRMVIGGTLGYQCMHLAQASVVYDDFFTSGGNCIDTAHIYGNSERIIGQWIKNRGIRDQVIILDKGAHTPWCDPINLTQQLFESLERMQTDYVDIYMMHRDNPDIPVGEFIAVLNEHVRAGRIKAFGGSNWTIERIEAANAYAQANGLQGFSAVSNNFSLARMIDAPWPGCLAASDPESREWFTKTQMPLMPWSSTSQGFIVFGDPENTADPNLARCWYSDENFARQARARELAAKKGVQPIVIAFAYVLNQPFPTFPLFGAQTLEEVRVALSALDLELTPAELKWLDTGE